ncbi:MAG: tetratricopeptide repeat-containing sensor histidine kinase [Prolixibacteraceae bacterium]|jgi:signal transduction histidine kinase
MPKYSTSYIFLLLISLVPVLTGFDVRNKSSLVKDSTVDQLVTKAYKLIAVATNHDSVVVLLDKAGKMAVQEKDVHQSINILILSGLNEYYSSNYEKAADMYYLALNQAEEAKDSILIAKVNHNLGMIYDEFEDYDEAVDYYQKSLKISQAVKDSELIATTFQNMAISFQNKKDLTRALSFNEKAQQLAILRKDTLMMIDVINNFGTIYYDQGKLDESMKYHIEALDLYQKRNDKQGLAYSYNNLGLVYLDKKEYQKSFDFFMKSLALANQMDMYEFTGTIYSNLTIFYEELKDYKNAYTYYDKYNTVYDSLIGERKSKMIREIQAKYLLAKKDNELEELKNRNQVQSNDIASAKSVQIYLIYIAIFIVFLMIATVYLLFREKRLANELKVKTNELKELNLAKDRFFSIIAHDLKNPFNILVSYTGILKSDLELFSTEELKKIISDLNQASENGFDLLQNLLVWTRSQTNRIRIFKSNFVLSEIFGQIRLLAELNLTAKNQKLIIQSEPDQLVYADKDMIATVIRNLVFNAIKFSPKGSEIVIKSSYADSFAHVEVIDHGVGISKENLDKLFVIDRNISTEGTDGETGTGLGLVICHEFIAKNNGEIKVGSKEGEGSVFSFSLPLDPAD